MKQKLLIIGAGMASARLIEELTKLAPKKYNISLFGAENHPNYNRIMLPHIMAGEKKLDDIIILDDKWYNANNIDFYPNKTITKIDRDKKQIFSGKEKYHYDKLIIATGSTSFFIPVPGSELDGVLGFRDYDDVEKILDKVKNDRKKIIIIGGGLLGIEAAAALKSLGNDVTIIHLTSHIMERQLDESAAYLLQKKLTGMGIKILCNAHTKAILGKDRVEAIALESGKILDADIVIMAAGIRPETRLAVDCALHVERAIVINDKMQTSDPDIFALGECVEHNNIIYGLVAPIYEMAKILAHNLAGESKKFTPTITSTKLKVSGVDLFSAGDISSSKDDEEILFRDPKMGIYKRLIIKNNRITGIVLFSDISDSGRFFEKLKTKQDISSCRDSLIFGANGKGSQNSTSLIANLADDAEICGCNGVCKGEIVAAIKNGATNIDAVKSVTKASASCGGCATDIEQILSLVLGDNFKDRPKKTICPCTNLSHQEIRANIKDKKLKSIAAIMQECNWKTSCGCAICRPALNYYLLANWPLEYKDDAQSRLVNERNHANIQKNGTYSVVPRMWGGMTTADELRAIADVADKYNVPTIHITGGQRIDLLGVKKSDLPNIWADLNKAGFVSGHAYAKGVRTVKTCVGKNYCRFGTQNSTALGINLEKILWGSWTPHKVKLAVSGCPRNCAEASCKDVGVICVDSGYEILVGGAAGIELKQAILLAKTASEQEVTDIIIAFVQLYRLEADYLDRPYKWIDKVGINYIKEKVVSDKKSRTHLCRQFEISQKIYRRDPWAEQSSEKYIKNKWTPLTAPKAKGERLDG